jgi:hypothetical protein
MWLQNLLRMTICCGYLSIIIIQSHVKKTLLMQFLGQRSPPNAAFASLGGHTVYLPAARGNTSVRFMLEFVVIPGNSVVAILRVVVGHLHPAGAAARW